MRTEPATLYSRFRLELVLFTLRRRCRISQRAERQMPVQPPQGATRKRRQFRGQTALQEPHEMLAGLGHAARPARRHHRRRDERHAAIGELVLVAIVASAKMDLLHALAGRLLRHSIEKNVAGAQFLHFGVVGGKPIVQSCGGSQTEMHGDQPLAEKQRGELHAQWGADRLVHEVAHERVDPLDLENIGLAGRFKLLALPRHQGCQAGGIGIPKAMTDRTMLRLGLALARANGLERRFRERRAILLIGGKPSTQIHDMAGMPCECRRVTGREDRIGTNGVFQRQQRQPRCPHQRARIELYIAAGDDALHVVDGTADRVPETGGASDAVTMEWKEENGHTRLIADQNACARPHLRDGFIKFRGQIRAWCRSIAGQELGPCRFVGRAERWALFNLETQHTQNAPHPIRTATASDFRRERVYSRLIGHDASDPATAHRRARTARMRFQTSGRHAHGDHSGDDQHETAPQARRHAFTYQEDRQTHTHGNTQIGRRVGGNRPDRMDEAVEYQQPDGRPGYRHHHQRHQARA